MLSKTYEYYYLNTSQLSESLCDGVAQRLFRDVRQHNERYKEHFLLNKPILLKDAVPKFARSLKKIASSRQGKLNDIIKMTNVCFFTDPNAPEIKTNIRGDSHIMRQGLEYKEGALFLYWVQINEGRPTKVKVSELPVSFSKHSVSRLIYRLRPNDLMSTIINLATILSSIVDTAIKPKSHGVKWWLHTPEMGGFLFANEGKSVNIVTFVDHEKLKSEQIEDGKQTFLRLSELAPKLTEQLLTFFDVHKHLVGEGRCRILTIS